MKDLSLHILDLLQNSIAALATRIEVVIRTEPDKGLLRIIIEDNGAGMDEGLLEKAADPFTTTRTTRRIGLGIPLMKASAERSGGGLDIVSEKGKGTKVEVFFQAENIDRPPLGDIAGTVAGLLASGTDTELKLVMDNGRESFVFDTVQIREKLGSVPLTEYEVVTWINGYLNEAIKDIFGGVLNEVDS